MSERLELKLVDECHYSCGLGDFYQIFAQKQDSWEFKASRILKEKEIILVLETMRRLNNP